MKNVIFVHGSPDKWQYYAARLLPFNSRQFYWAGWLGQQLKKENIKYYAPEIPKSYTPDWHIWRRAIEQHQIGPNTLLIGHSAGGGFWLRFLSENPKIKVGKVILIAPFIDVEKRKGLEFFNFKLDKNLAGRTSELIIFYSTNDKPHIQNSLKYLKSNLKGAEFRKFYNYGHFIGMNLRWRKFPELLEECLAGNT